MLDINNLQLQYKCPKCYGTGKLSDSCYQARNLYENCYECGGFGYKLNPLGEEILELVKHRLGLTIRTEANE
jgi:hypothetical protein